MIGFGLICLIAVGLQNGIANGEQGGFTSISHGPGFAGASSGSFSNTGQGGGHQGQGGYNPQQPFFPFPQFPAFPQFAPFPQPFAPFPAVPNIDPNQFNKYLNQYFDILQKNYAHTLATTQTSPGNSAYANSYYVPDTYYELQLEHQKAVQKALQQQGGYTPYAQGGYAPNFAGASAAYAPGVFHQTASISPANPESPNVDTRFSADGQEPGKPNYFGLSTSSFSESANVNGVESNRRGAITTVNDNGKVTSYQAQS